MCPWFKSRWHHKNPDIVLIWCLGFLFNQIQMSFENRPCKMVFQGINLISDGIGFTTKAFQKADPISSEKRPKY
ncbi:MAG: hypothetical protein C0397_13875 [Odoribacter sp.]|nr:hypothetical protein [Odoribacter sp.]